MRAVVLAAGRGTRLRPLTNDRPKCLVPLYGRPLIEYTLAAFQSCGIDDVTVVTGYRAEMLGALDVDFRHNERFETTNMVHSLFCAEDLFDDELIVSYGDIVFRPGLLEALLSDGAGVSVVVDQRWRELWELRMDDPLADAETLRLGEGDTIVELGKTPSGYDEIQGQYIGLMRLSREAAPRIRRFYHDLDREARYDGQDFDNMYLTSFIQAVIDDLMPVHAVRVDGGWIEVDSTDDLEVYRSREPEIRHRLGLTDADR